MMVSCSLFKKIMGVTLLFAVTLYALTSEGFALGRGMDSNTPIEVSADDALVWEREDKAYIARGNAKAIQGKNSLEGTEIKAFYGENSAKKQGKNRINKIEAIGQVVLRSDGNTAYAERAVYDLKTGEAVLTGNNLILDTGREVITARDRITFNTNSNIMRVIGNAKLEHENDVLQSNQFTAYFKDVDGSLALREMHADGNAVITTPAERITGDKAIYNADRNEAEIIGNVVVTRGQNRLTGARGKVDLTTKKSTLLGAGGTSINTPNETRQPGITQSSDGRVRGVFFPE